MKVLRVQPRLEAFRSARMMRMPRSLGGLTLIEVLIALLVLSIGLVGVAVLHLNSIKFAHSSYYSSIASSVALDLEERLWIEVAANDGECLTVAEINAVLADLQDQWGGTGSGGVVIPGLNVAVSTGGSITPGDIDSPWSEVPITVSWTDGRVSDVAETFHYIARVICFEFEFEE